MKKKFRLTENDDFVKLIKKKNFVSNKEFTIYFLPNDLGYVRVGISVGKKHGNAVLRNKVKRQIRMMVSQSFNYQEGIDFLVMIRPQYLENDYEINNASLIKLYQKIQQRGANK